MGDVKRIINALSVWVLMLSWIVMFWMVIDTRRQAVQTNRFIERLLDAVDGADAQRQEGRDDG